MAIRKSSIVCSTAGRDKDRIFVVLAVDDEFALLVDGKMRKLEKPKRKKLKHLKFVADNATRLSEKLLSGEKFTNAEVRRTLTEFRQNNTTT